MASVVVAVGGLVLLGTGVLAILSIGLPILAAGALGFAAAVRPGPGPKGGGERGPGGAP